MPSYSAKYQLNNDDYNVQQLRKRYNIPTKQAPELKLKGDGDLKGSSVGSKSLEFTFVENKKKTSILQMRYNLPQVRIINHESDRISNKPWQYNK